MRKSPRLLSVEQVAHRKRLVLSVPLPMFGWLGRIREKGIGYVFSMILFFAGVSGVIFSIAPTLFQSTPTTASSSSLVPTTAVQQKPSLPRSLPVSLEVPDISLKTDLIQLGKNEDGSMETPEGYEQAGWYKYSPTPGEIGPAVIAGHVDSYQGPAVFFYLKDLQPGQLIYVDRKDGSRATFRVDKTAVFDQSAFPTDEVYGNIEHSGLRLITCGGVFNALTGHYSHNTVVYASFVPDKRQSKT